MNFAIRQEDVDYLRSYVTAKDGHEHEGVEPGIVCFDITHNYLKVRMHGIRMPFASTIYELKEKIALHTGTPVDYQRLELRTRAGSKVRDLLQDNATLEQYSFQHGMEVHCIDFNPNSLAKDGGLDDVSQVKKREMTEEEYNKRENTVRAQRLAKEAQRIAEGKTADNEYSEESVKGMNVGDRCEVNPGGRRGTIRWIGVLEKGEVNRGGYWVGIALDEPSGKNDGSYKGEKLFSCPMNYGIFARGPNVVVGDFPEEDFDLEEEF